MKSPITGKEMSLHKEERTMTFRKEPFNVLYHYFLCEDSKEQFTSTELDEININQLYNQYLSSKISNLEQSIDQV